MGHHCSALGDGFSCQQADGEPFCGVASECDPRTFGQRCEGDVAVVCEAGKTLRVDCDSLGFPACAGTESVACEGAGTH